MDRLKKPAPAEPFGPCDDSSPTDRRRIGRVVHDERGAASLEWQEVPLDRTDRFKRLRLSVEGEPGGGALRTGGSGRAARGYDPYQRVGRGAAPSGTSKPTRRDLRKLGEWIKLMRELEERRARGETDDD